jgi:hypothetical protein
VRNLKIHHTIILFALLFRCTSAGAPPLTTIQDTLYKADGSPFEGVLAVNWKSFEAPDESSIPTNNLSVTVVKGALFIRLVPTVTSPTPAYYAVRYIVGGALQNTEYWTVPLTENKMRLKDVRVAWPPSPSAGNQTGTISINNIEGLPQELSVRPTKGQNYAASKAAVIGTTGELGGAIGNPGDCLRVDGSSGPCGDGDFGNELNIRPTKGPGYAPSRTAVISSTGQLEAAAGSAANCVRVDGSSGPCDPVSLPQELSIRPTKGPGYFPSRAAVISSAGTLQAAAGLASDCVRADGSTAPCDAPLPAIIEALPHELSIRPAKGAGYVASRAAVIGPTGTLEAASGASSNCVRVDGSTGPCGSGSGTSADFVDEDTPSGIVNGVNASFTLSGVPGPVSSLQLFRNGVLQKRGIDYNISGKLVTFLPLAIPKAGDLLLAYYRIWN